MNCLTPSIQCPDVTSHQRQRITTWTPMGNNVTHQSFPTMGSVQKPITPHGKDMTILHRAVAVIVCLAQPNHVFTPSSHAPVPVIGLCMYTLFYLQARQLHACHRLSWVHRNTAQTQPMQSTQCTLSAAVLVHHMESDESHQIGCSSDDATQAQILPGTTSTPPTPTHHEPAKPRRSVRLETIPHAVSRAHSLANMCYSVQSSRTFIALARLGRRVLYMAA